ncbi:hypothetical protein BaRGS_00033169, partial [Batillaria attramentaria]
GHGGRGGHAGRLFLTSSQSAAHGSFHDPTAFGGGGGGASSCGGSGGGVVKITASDYVTIDGVVSARGERVKTDKPEAAEGALEAVSRSMPSVYLYPLLDPTNSRTWRPTSSNANSAWIELRVPEGYYVTSVETRGGVNYDSYVKKYRLQYYDNEAENWKTMLDADYNKAVPANTDRTSLVKRHFAFPVLTTKVRVFPHDWTQNGVAMTARLYGYKAVTEPEYFNRQSTAPVLGGAGGPGTVFWVTQQNQGVGELRLDNRAQGSGISFTGDDLDLVATGAAGWLEQSSQTLDKIVLSNSAILAIDADVAVSVIESDNTSLVYVKGPRTLTIGNTFDGNKYVAQSATLALALDSDVTLRRWSYIMGTLSVQGTEELTVAGNMTLQAQPLTLLGLTVEEESIMNVTGSATFPLTVTSLVVYGDFHAQAVQLTNVKTFSTGPRSNMTFNPLTSGAYLGNVTDIRGDLHLAKPVSFQNCARLMIDGGKLTWDGNTSTTIDCTNVTINGFLQPFGDVIFGRDVRDIMVGPQGSFRFRAGGPIFTHTLSVSGVLEVKNKVILQSPVATYKRLVSLVVHGPGGKLMLDTHNEFSMDNGAEVANVDYSELYAQAITVNGLFDAQRLAFAENVSRLTVGNGGNFTFDPTTGISVDYITTHGILTSKSPLNIVGNTLDHVYELLVGENGTMTLDAGAANGEVAVGQSELSADKITVNGRFDARKLAFTSRISTLTVGNGGRFTFDPMTEISVNSITVHGVLTSQLPLNVTGNTLIRAREIEVGQHGTMTLDARAQARGGFSGVSYLVVETVTVGGTLNAGRLINHGPPLLHGWNTLSVGANGRFTFLPDDIFYLGYGEVAGFMESLTIITILPPPAYETNSNHFVVDTGGHVKLGVREASHLANNVTCERLEVKAGGTLDAGYQKPPPDATTVSPLSEFLITTLVVGGTLKGDSVKIVSNDVTVGSGGSISAAGGGFASNAGPGAGVASSSGASGASHGGRGGRGRTSAPFTLASNLPYGSIFDANTWGSGGGGTSPSNQNGGRGGGYIVMEVADEFDVDGTVSVDGLSATATHGGGGSGGSLQVTCVQFTGSGRLTSNGGSGQGGGGGGAGGRVLVQFTSGGSGAEPGGPGLAYLHGDNIRNLRVDNNCQRPAVTEHGGTWADEAAYQDYIHTGGIAYLLPKTADYVYDFTILELYGGAHLTFSGTRTKVKAIQIVGDDTGHLHVAPSHTVEWTQSHRGCHGGCVHPQGSYPVSKLLEVFTLYTTYYTTTPHILHTNAPRVQH